MSTGVKRLDDLTDGGLEERTATLLFGPTFCGKEILARLFMLQGMAERVPAIYVLTDKQASRAREELLEMDPNIQGYEEEGLLRFVDAYSRQIGAGEALETVEYVDGPANLNAITVAINNAQRSVIGQHEHHRLVLDSASTLIAHTNAQTTFRFLQVLLGKAKLAGGTTMVLLERGMHPAEEVETIKHLMDGVIEFAQDEKERMLRVQGRHSANHQGWIEYTFDRTHVELTGSFAEGRIH